MIVAVFRIRMKPEADVKDYWARVSKLVPLAQAIPGFVSVSNYSSEDGERLAIVEFETEEALAQWQQNPEHLIAQELGRTTFYSDLKVQICRTIREYGFKAPTG
jgi:heme-degrading monooxygenase HmoA